MPALLPLAVLAASLASAEPLTAPRFAGLLQRFVTAQYGRSFAALGDERDFDHGHVLCDAAGRPVALLYHTSEDAPKSARGPRSWLQWVADGRIEDAARYERRAYPKTAAWELFVRRRLPELKKRGTVTDAMLDPAALGIDEAKTVQWVFTRVDCSAAAIRSTLPDGRIVCLSLSAS